MNENSRSERLEMRWLPVADATGRVHMEAVWVSVPTIATLATTSVSHAA